MDYLDEAYVDFRESFMDNFGQLFNSADNSDIILKVSNTKFYCHKLILATQCEYFRAMFYGGMAESNTEITEIDLPEKPEAFGAILRFMYSGKIILTDFKTDVLLDIRNLAHMYGFVKLQTQLCKLLIRILDPENAITIRDTAIKYSLDELLEECKQYIAIHADAVFMSKNSTTLTKEDVIDLMRYSAFRSTALFWLDHNMKECPKLVADTLVLLHLPPKGEGDSLSVVWPKKYNRDGAIKALQIQLTEASGDSELYVKRFFNSVLVPEENIATLMNKSSVIRGGHKYQLYQNDCPDGEMARMRDVPLLESRYPSIVLERPGLQYATKQAKLSRGFSDYSTLGGHDYATIRLGRSGIINTIQLSQALKGSVYSSINGKNYAFLNDFKSETIKHFHTIVTEYIRIVEDDEDNGTTYGYKTFFQCYHTVNAP